ncbi:MAG TPA: hypothetical protein VGW76_05570 [Pyrinomonadaceae bacterium]|nr:hypothetical protein [Pyrinomonadaceae bacterium]
MSSSEDVSLESSRTQLEERLRRVNEQLRKEMLARGFDPAQDENLALTAPLAKLYMEREQLRAQLDTLSGGEKLTVERDES